MWEWVFRVEKIKLNLHFHWLYACPHVTYWVLGLILMVAARNMESEASFFIHDDSDGGSSVAHIAVKTAANTQVCRPKTCHYCYSQFYQSHKALHPDGEAWLSDRGNPIKYFSSSAGRAGSCEAGLDNSYLDQVMCDSGRHNIGETVWINLPRK